MKSTITKKDWNKYLLELYFGRKQPLVGCIDRAYRDFSRTLHGFGKADNKEKTREKAGEYLKTKLEEIINIEISTQENFDEWHQETCSEIQNIFKTGSSHTLYIGQAQKWINMSFKYIYTYGDNYLKGYEKIYNYCHVPIDNILLKELKKYEPPKLKTAWSKIPDYKTYLEYQKWFHVFNKIPLDVEFKIWQGEKP